MFNEYSLTGERQEGIPQAASNFEASLLTRTRNPFIHPPAGFDLRKVTGDPSFVATIATNGPVQADQAGAVIDNLTGRMHPVLADHKVLFVDCSPVISVISPRLTFAQLSTELATGTLSRMLEAIKSNNINLRGYTDLEQYVQLQQTLSRQFTGSSLEGYDYPGLIFRLARALSIGNKRSFLGTVRRDPVYIFPVFNFSKNLLPVANSHMLQPGADYVSVSDELARETAIFYKYAQAIRLLEPEGGSDHDGYGPDGRTIIVPEVILYALGEVIGRGKFPNITQAVSRINEEKINERDLGRIRGQDINSFMFEDAISGELIGQPSGHSRFRYPRGFNAL